MKGLTFSEAMMKAWLEGRITVTRKLMKPQPAIVVGDQLQPNVWYAANRGDFAGDPERQLRPPYQPGKTVYIKETWADLRGMGFGNDPRTDNPFLAAYKADTKPGTDGDRVRKDYGVKWKSPRFMPEWAARSHALIKSVRPERIQSIEEPDVLRECPPTFWTNQGGPGQAFIDLWESLHPGSWERNDWVWRIELEKQ